MATETLMTLRQLALELGVPYAHVWQSARTMDLIDYRQASRNIIVTVDDEKMAVFRKAVDIRNRYNVIFPLALKMAQDGWAEPDSPRMPK